MPLPLEMKHVKYLNGHTALAKFMMQSKPTKERVAIGGHSHCAGSVCCCAKVVAIYKGKRVVLLDVPYQTAYRVMEVL